MLQICFGDKICRWQKVFNAPSHFTKTYLINTNDSDCNKCPAWSKGYRNSWIQTSNNCLLSMFILLYQKRLLLLLSYIWHYNKALHSHSCYIAVVPSSPDITTTIENYPTPSPTFSRHVVIHINWKALEELGKKYCVGGWLLCAPFSNEFHYCCMTARVLLWSAGS